MAICRSHEGAQMLQFAHWLATFRTAYRTSFRKLHHEQAIMMIMAVILSSAAHRIIAAHAQEMSFIILLPEGVVRNYNWKVNYFPAQFNFNLNVGRNVFIRLISANLETVTNFETWTISITKNGSYCMVLKQYNMIKWAYIIRSCSRPCPCPM